jgi:hypothetical protein
MPVRCDIFRPDRIAIGVAEGPVTLRDLELFLDTLEQEGAIGFAKIFDATFGTVAMNEADWTILAAEVGAYLDKKALGPLAIVSASGALSDLGPRLAGLKSGTRPAKIFRSIHDARAWLRTLEPARA